MTFPLGGLLRLNELLRTSTEHEDFGTGFEKIECAIARPIPPMLPRLM